MAPPAANADMEDRMDDVEEAKLPELKLDAKQVRGFISFYGRLSEDDQVIRFFDRKDYYTAHGENAVFIAKTYYHTLTALRQLGNESDALSSVSISRSMFETIVRDLLLTRTDHTIELYEGSGSNWRLVKTGTPGRLGSFEDVLFASNDMHDTPVVMAVQVTVHENERLVGMAFVNLIKRSMGLAEFLDADQDVGRLVKGSAEQLKDMIFASKTAARALGALLSYTELLADDSNQLLRRTVINSTEG